MSRWFDIRRGTLPTPLFRVHFHQIAMIFEEDEPDNGGGGGGTGHVAFVECTSGLHSFRVGQHPQTGAVDLTTLVVDADLATVLHGVASAPWFAQRLKTCTTVAALATA
jgi:hypothetical protein